MGLRGTNRKTWTKRTSKTSQRQQAGLLACSHQGAAEAGTGRGFDLPAVARQELPQGAEKKREAMSCQDPQGSMRKGWRHGNPEHHLPRGGTASICNKLSSGGGCGNQGFPENSPSTGVKKADYGGQVSK